MKHVNKGFYLVVAQGPLANVILMMPGLAPPLYNKHYTLDPRRYRWAKSNAAFFFLSRPSQHFSQ